MKITISIITVLILLSCGILYSDTVTYSYDAGKSEITIFLNGQEIQPDDPILEGLNTDWRAYNVQMGSNGWSVDCENSGSGCVDTIEETQIIWLMLY